MIDVILGIIVLAAVVGACVVAYRSFILKKSTRSKGRKGDD